MCYAGVVANDADPRGEHVKYTDLATEAASYLEVVQSVRRDLHQIPEFGLQLPKTLERVLASISGLGEIHLGKSITSAVLHIKGGQPGPTVLLRFDMDALAVVEETGLPFASTNGYMHACGHDLHMAIGIGAAHLLATHSADLKGDVILFFQPGEEGHNGAGVMIDEGSHLVSGSKPIAAFGLHVFSAYIPNGVFLTRPGAMMASSGDMIVKFKGSAGHGSSPWMAKDPVSAMAEAMSALQTMVAKRFNVFDPVVVNVGWVKAGDTHTTNVIPETASFGATLRTFSKENETKLREYAASLMHDIARGFGVEAEVEFSPYSPVVYNDPEAVKRVERVVKETLGDHRYAPLPTPMTGGEDFSVILNEIPGSFIFLGAGPKDGNYETAPVNHSNRAVFDDSVIPDACAVMASLVFDTLDEAAR